MSAGFGQNGVALPFPVRRGQAGLADPGRQGLDGVLTCAAGLIGGAVLLVSCADRTATIPAAPSVASPPVATAAVEVPPSPVPRTKPAVPPVASAPAMAAAAVRTAPVEQPHSPEVAIKVPENPLALDPATLVGMSERDMVQLLGQPVWTEEIPPAKTWQYGNARCRLRVFLFMEMTTRDFRTLSYELTSTDGQPYVAQQCFAELIAEAWHP